MVMSDYQTVQNSPEQSRTVQNSPEQSRTVQNSPAKKARTRLTNNMLVGGWPTPLKNMKVSWDDEIPNI